MARYIDADKFIKQFERALEHQQKYGLYNHAKLTECVIKAIENEPTADVVPKSEVDRVYYNLQAVLEERAETKREIAREIFEEIDKLSHKFMNDKHYIFGDMVWDINELKKKYTEGKDEQAPTRDPI